MSLIKEYLAKYEAKDFRLKPGGILSFDEMSRRINKKGAINRVELISIVHWKPSKKIGSVEKNSSAEIDKITRYVISDLKGVKYDDLKLRVLRALKGVGLGVASTILTLIDPKIYGILDISAWTSLFFLQQEGELKRYSIDGALARKMEDRELKDEYWSMYLGIIRKIGKNDKLTPHQVDRALYTYCRKLQQEGKVVRI